MRFSVFSRREGSWHLERDHFLAASCLGPSMNFRWVDSDCPVYLLVLQKVELKGKVQKIVQKMVNDFSDFS